MNSEVIKMQVCVCYLNGCPSSDFWTAWITDL